MCQVCHTRPMMIDCNILVLHTRHIMIGCNVYGPFFQMTRILFSENARRPANVFVDYQ